MNAGHALEAIGDFSMAERNYYESLQLLQSLSKDGEDYETKTALADDYAHLGQIEKVLAHRSHRDRVPSQARLILARSYDEQARNIYRQVLSQSGGLPLYSRVLLASIETGTPSLCADRVGALLPRN